MDGFFFGQSLMTSVLLALALDALLGDPRWLWSRMTHPVVWIGKLAEAWEARFNVGEQRVYKGLFAWGAVVGFVALVGLVIQILLLQWAFGWIMVGLLGSIGLAARSLDQHVRAVAVGLDESLESGQAAVRLIVGRDPEALDGPGVARAAVESLAENASDGFVAPLFWFLLLGLPGLFAYKAINTLDSMWGYRTVRFEAFGKAAARIDDAANLIPARLTAFFVSMATGTLFPLMAALRDGPKHRSPNAGYPEAAFASALRLSLAGPRLYDGVMSTDAPMGQGTRNVTPGHIRAALKLFWYMWGLIAMICVVITTIAWLV